MLGVGTWSVRTREALPVEASADGEEDGLMRFSSLPLDGETPLILTSHFGKFRAEVNLGVESRRLRGRLAFSCSEPGPNEDPVERQPVSASRDDNEQQVGAVDVPDFWFCRILMRRT